MNVMPAILNAACVLCVVFLKALSSLADGVFDATRTRPIAGSVSDAETDVTVELKATGMEAGAKCVYLTKAENGQFLQNVKLFPGQNLVTAKTASGSQERILPFSVRKPTLRVHLDCPNSYYHLVVNDWYGGGGLSETFYQREAEAGLYRISVYHMVEGREFVDYDENGNPIWRDVPPVAAETTVSVYVNDVLVSRTANGDGKLRWSVGSIVLHSGDQVGGYSVDGNRLDLAGQGERKGYSPQSGWYCEVTGLVGPNGGGPVFLVSGSAAQFSASGTLFQYGYGEDQTVNVIECFSSSDDTIGSIDALGVFVAKAPGHTQIFCEGYSGDPIDVYVVQAGITVDADFDNDVDSDDEAKMVACASPYRWSMPVATNVFHPVRLDTGVAASGALGLTLAGDAAFRVWATDAPGPSDLPLIDLPDGSVGGEALGITLPYTGSTTLFVEAASNGTATLTYAFVGSGTVAGAVFSSAVQLAAWDIGIAADYDRDGVINATDFKRTLTNEVFRFWVNDDKDSGDVATDGSDVPGQADGNFSDGVVNGRCDLADFFPVFLNVSALFGAVGLDPLTVSARLRQADGAVNVVWTGLASEDAGTFQRSDVGTCGEFCTSLGYSAASVQVTSGGVTLPPAFLLATLSHGSNGVVMVEARKPTTKPLVLELLSQGSVVCRASLPLSISSVEDMYDRLSLCDGDAITVSGNNASSSTVQHGQFIFAHGYNVSETQARGWGAEVFKRMWQSGMNAKYTAVTWNGSESQTSYSLPGFGLRSPNYYVNVSNAFEAASRLRTAVSAMEGNNKVIAAHSLGNMLVSSAIQDYGMGVSKYFMLNAAVAAECYDASLFDTDAQNSMVHGDWRSYNSTTWSVSWHDLFPSDDRATLTWTNRFFAVCSVAYNYYSSMDEVFELYNGTPWPSTGYTGTSDSVGRYSWQKQELFKGRTASSDTLTSWLTRSDLAGWGFRGTWSGSVFWPTYAFDEANTLSPDEIRAQSVFHPNPDAMFQPSISLADRIRILSYGIPALSQAAGGRLVNIPSSGNETREVNMNALEHPNGWWRFDAGDLSRRWLHSDLKEVSYYYVYALFDNLVETGGLK